MRTGAELRKDFADSGEGDFGTWLKNQPEGNPGPVGEVSSTKSYPGILDMGRGAGKAAIDAVTSGARLVSDTEKERRWLICQGNECGYFDEEQVRCMKCGCWVRLKTALEAWHCPIGKW